MEPVGIAEAEFRVALALRTEALGASHPTVAALRGNLVAILSRHGKYEESEREAWEAYWEEPYAE